MLHPRGRYCGRGATGLDLGVQMFNLTTTSSTATSASVHSLLVNAGFDDQSDVMVKTLHA